MVRETRYLWVGNLPEKVTEERIVEHFKRHGKIQSVKLLTQPENEKPCATVAFMDIKSASKAHNTENKLDGTVVYTQYSEPSQTGTTVTITRTLENEGATRGEGHRAVYTAPKSTATRYPNRTDGLQEERNYERSEYGYRVNDLQNQYEGRRASYEEGSEQLERGRVKQRFAAPQAVRGSYTQRQQFDRESPRQTPAGQVSSAVGGFEGSFSGSSSERRVRSKAWDGQSPARSDASLGSRQRSFRRSTSRSPAGSRSSSSSSSSRSSSTSSRSHSRSSKASRDHHDRLPSGPASVAIAPPNSLLDKRKESNQTPSGSGSSSNDGERKNLGICIRGLPVRSSDTSLRDGLFHEYKKHGQVTSVNVFGANDTRHAIVSFKKPEDAAKALEASQDKMFFGTKIQVDPHEGFERWYFQTASCLPSGCAFILSECEDNEFKPPQAELDEYHPKATRTLFVGNLEKEISSTQLREIFDPFGEIIVSDIDIKKQGAVSAYAFVQYDDIASVVKALRKMDGEHIGNNKIKLGFGKSMPTNCVWLDCIVEAVSEKLLCRQFGRYGPVSHSVCDRVTGRALVYFENMEYAQHAVNEMRGRILGGKKIQIDFASRDCQTAFFVKMERTGQLRPGERPDERAGRVYRQAQVYAATSREGSIGFTTSERAAAFASVYAERTVRGRTAFQRSSTPRSTTSGTFRSSRATSSRAYYEGYRDEFRDGRTRYEFETGDGSGGEGGLYAPDSYEQELGDYRYRQQERRDRTSSLSPTRRRSPSPFMRTRLGSPTHDRHERFDAFGERYAFRDTDSQSGDRESVRSFLSVRSEARLPREFRERAYSDRFADDRFPEKTVRGYSPASSDYSQRSRTPPFRSRSTSPVLKTKERKQPKSYGRPVSPTFRSSRHSSPESYEYKDAKCKEKCKYDKEEYYKKRDMRERVDSEERTSIAKLMGQTTLTSIASEVKARSKLNSEDDNSDADKTAKRLELIEKLKKHPDLLDDSETARKASHLRSRSASSGSRTRLCTDPNSTDTHNFTVTVGKHGGDKLSKKSSGKKKGGGKHKDKKYDKNAPYDPWDPHSGKSSGSSDSDSSSEGKVPDSDDEVLLDDAKLQKERQHLLNLLKQLDDSGSTSDTEMIVDEDGNKRPKRARIDDVLLSRHSSRFTISMLENLKPPEPHKPGFKPDSTQSLRKQMEARKRLEAEALYKMSKSNSVDGKLISPPLHGAVLHLGDDNDYDVASDKSPKEIPSEFISKKKRKTDLIDSDPLHKGRRTYRTKHPNEDMYGPSSGDESEAMSVTSSRKSAEERLLEEAKHEKVEAKPKERLETHPVPIKLECDPGCEPPRDPRLSLVHRRGSADIDATLGVKKELLLPLPKFARHIQHHVPKAASPPPPPPPPPPPKVEESPKIVAEEAPSTSTLVAPVPATPTTPSTPVTVDANVSKGDSSPPFSPNNHPHPHEAPAVGTTEAAAAVTDDAAESTKDPADLLAIPPVALPVTTTPEARKDDVTKSETKTPPKAELSTSPPFKIDSSESDNSPPNSPGHMSLDDRIRALDEKMSMASKPPTIGFTPSVLDYREKYRVRKRVDSNPINVNLTDSKTSDHSDIVRSLLSRSSIIDQDSRRLEQIDEKYEPKDISMSEEAQQGGVFRVRMADDDWPTLTPPMSTPLPVVSSLTTPPSSAPPFQTSPSTPGLGSGVSGSAATGVPAQSSSSSSSSSPLLSSHGVNVNTPHSAPALIGGSPFSTPNKPSSESPSARAYGSKKQNSLEAKSSLSLAPPPLTPTHTPPSPLPGSASLEMPKLTPKKEPFLGAQTSPTMPAPILKKQESTDSAPSLPATPTVTKGKDMPSLLAPTNQDLTNSVSKESKDTPTKRDSSSSSLLGKRKASEDTKDVKTPKSDSKSDKSKQSKSDSKSEEPDAKKAKVSASSKDKDKKHESSSKSSHSKDAKKTSSSKHSTNKSPEKKHKSDSHKSETHKTETEKKDGEKKDEKSAKHSEKSSSKEKEKCKDKDKEKKDKDEKDPEGGKEKHREHSKDRHQSTERHEKDAVDKDAKVKDAKHKVDKVVKDTKEAPGTPEAKPEKKDAKVDKKEKSKSKSTDKHKEKVKESSSEMKPKEGSSDSTKVKDTVNTEVKTSSAEAKSMSSDVKSASSDAKSKPKTTDKHKSESTKHKSDKSHKSDKTERTDKNEQKEAPKVDAPEKKEPEKVEKKNEEKKECKEKVETKGKPKDKHDKKSDKNRHTSGAKDKKGDKSSEKQTTSKEESKTDKSDKSEKTDNKSNEKSDSQKSDKQKDKSESSGDKSETKSERRKSEGRSRKDSRAEESGCPRELRELGLDENDLMPYFSMYDMVKRRSCKEKPKDEETTPSKSKQLNKLQESRRRRSKASKFDDTESSLGETEDEESAHSNAESAKKDSGKKPNNAKAKAKRWIINSSSDEDEDEVMSQASESLDVLIKEKQDRKQSTGRPPKSPIYTEDEDEFSPKPKKKLKQKKKSKQFSFDSDSFEEETPSKTTPKAKEMETPNKVKGKKGMKGKENLVETDSDGDESPPKPASKQKDPGSAKGKKKTPKSKETTPNSQDFPPPPKTPKGKSKEKKDKLKMKDKAESAFAFSDDSDSEDIIGTLTANRMKERKGGKQSIIESEEEDNEEEDVDTESFLPEFDRTSSAKKIKEKTVKKKLIESDKEDETPQKVAVTPKAKNKEKLKTEIKKPFEDKSEPPAPPPQPLPLAKPDERKDLDKPTPTKPKKNKHKDKQKKAVSNDTKEENLEREDGKDITDKEKKIKKKDKKTELMKRAEESYMFDDFSDTEKNDTILDMDSPEVKEESKAEVEDIKPMNAFDLDFMKDPMVIHDESSKLALLKADTYAMSQEIKENSLHDPSDIKYELMENNIDGTQDVPVVKEPKKKMKKKDKKLSEKSLALEESINDMNRVDMNSDEIIKSDIKPKKKKVKKKKAKNQDVEGDLLEKVNGGRTVENAELEKQAVLKDGMTCHWKGDNIFEKMEMNQNQQIKEVTKKHSDKKEGKKAKKELEKAKLEAERERAELAAKEKAAADEARKKALEEELAELKAAQEEAARQLLAAEEEAARQRAAEEEANHQREELARLAAEEEASKRAEEEKLRAEAAAREEAARRKAEEEERQRLEEARLKAEEEKRMAGEAKRRAEEEARRKAEEEARRRAEETRRREEEERRKAEEARRKAEEEARLKAEEETRRKVEEERQRAMKEAMEKAEAEAKRKVEEARRRAEEEQRRKAIEEARLQADQERRRKAEEEARQRAEEEKRRKEEEKRQEEARRKSEEEARRKAEAEAARKAEEESARRREEEERRAKEKEAREQAEREKAAAEKARQEREARVKELAAREEQLRQLEMEEAHVEVEEQTVHIGGDEEDDIPDASEVPLGDSTSESQESQEIKSQGISLENDSKEEEITTEIVTDEIVESPVEGGLVIAEDVEEEEESQSDADVLQNKPSMFMAHEDVSDDQVSQDNDDSNDMLPKLEIDFDAEPAPDPQDLKQENKPAVSGRLVVPEQETEAAVAGLEELLKLEEPAPGLSAPTNAFTLGDSEDTLDAEPKEEEEALNESKEADALESGESVPEEEAAVLALAEIAELQEAAGKEKRMPLQLEIPPHQSPHHVLMSPHLHQVSPRLHHSPLLASPLLHHSPHSQMSPHLSPRLHLSPLSTGSQHHSSEEHEHMQMPPSAHELLAKDDKDPGHESKSEASDAELVIDTTPVRGRPRKPKSKSRSKKKTAAAAAAAKASEVAKTPKADDDGEPEKPPVVNEDELMAAISSILPGEEGPTGGDQPSATDENEGDESEDKKDELFEDSDKQPSISNSDDKADDMKNELSLDDSFSEERKDDSFGEDRRDDSFGEDRKDESYLDERKEEDLEELVQINDKRTRRSRKSRRVAAAAAAKEEGEDTEKDEAGSREPSKSPARSRRGDNDEEGPRTPRRRAETPTEKFSSRGRKIIPKEPDDDLTGFSGQRKGRKGQEVEGRGRSRRLTALAQQEEAKQAETSGKPPKRGRRTSSRLAKDDEQAEAEEKDDMGEEERESKEEEGSDLEEGLPKGRRTPRRKLRARVSAKVPEKEEGDEAKLNEEKKEEEEDELNTSMEKEPEADAPNEIIGESPRPKRGRKSKQRRSFDGSMSPRTRSSEGGSQSPRGRALDSGATSPKPSEFSKPIVKLEKLNIDQTYKREDGKRGEEIRDEMNQANAPRYSFTRHGGRLLAAQADAEKDQPKAAKDLYEWEDDEEKPPPEMLHKRQRKRKVEWGGESPRRPVFDDISQDSQENKKPRIEEPEEDMKEETPNERQPEENKAMEVDKVPEPPVKTKVEPPKAKLVESVPKIKPVEPPPKPKQPEIPKLTIKTSGSVPKITTPMPEAAVITPVTPIVTSSLTSPSDVHMSPKSDFRKDNEDFGEPPQKMLGLSPTRPEPVPSPVHLAEDSDIIELTPTPEEIRMRNVDKIIDDVAKGNFEAAIIPVGKSKSDEPVPVPNRKRHSRSKSREDQMSPRANVIPISSIPSTMSAPCVMTSQVSGVVSSPKTTSPMVNSSPMLPIHGLHGSPQVVFPVVSKPEDLLKAEAKVKNEVKLKGEAVSTGASVTPASSASLGRDVMSKAALENMISKSDIKTGITMSLPSPKPTFQNVTAGMLPIKSSPSTTPMTSPTARTSHLPITSVPAFSMAGGLGQGNTPLMSSLAGASGAVMRLSGQTSTSHHVSPTSVITPTPPTSIPTQNPILALQKAGYPVTSHDLDRDRRQGTASPKGNLKSPPASGASGSSSGTPATTSSSQVIEIVPNPNMLSPAAKMMNESQGKHPPSGGDGHDQPQQQQRPSPSPHMVGKSGMPPHAAVHAPPSSQAQPHPKDGLQLPGQHGVHGLHLPPGYTHNQGLYHNIMTSQSGAQTHPTSTTTSSGTSELRAALAQPSKLVQQEQMLQQQRMQQHQQQMRPITPHQEHPGMMGHPRLGFPFPGQQQHKTSPSGVDPKNPGQLFGDHPPGKDVRVTSASSAFSALDGRMGHPDQRGAPPRPGMPLHGDSRPGMPHGEPRPAMQHGDQRPGLPHPDQRPGLPQHLYPENMRFPHPGMGYPPGGLPMGVARMGMDPRMMFPHHSEMFQQGAPAHLIAGLPPQHAQHILSQGVPVDHPMIHDRPGSARPSSAHSSSAQPSPRGTPTPTPSPGSTSGHPHPHPGQPMVGQHGAGPLVGHGGVRQMDIPQYAEPIFLILQQFPVMWQGTLALKNDSSIVQMHTLAGNQNLIKALGPHQSTLRIAQRMRLEPAQLEGVARRMVNESDFSMLVALPCGHHHVDVMQQTKQMRTGFIEYLQQKQAAGIVNVPLPGSTQPGFVIHIFPPCEFSNSNLARLAPELLPSLIEMDHLLIVIATV